MKKIIIALSLLILIVSPELSKADNYPTGAESLAMGGASVSFINGWSVHHNQGALGFTEGINTGIYYETSFILPEMSTKGLMFTCATQHGTFGLDATSYGFSKFSDNKIGFAYGLKLFSFLSIGIQLDYFHIQQDAAYGNFDLFSGEIGLLARPTDNLNIGVHVFNPWHSKLYKNSNDYLQTIFNTGFLYNFNDAVIFTAEVQKDLDLPVMFKTGIQYQPIENLSLRLGGTIFEKYFLPSFGVGYSIKNLKIDLGFESQPLIGMKSGISIEYKFK